MADNVQWIKLKVGTFDGNSFKKIKRAKIGGVSYRDKLTAVWFELLDLAGKCNADGFLIENKEIPYQSFEDIAIMLDREEKEIELCMQFFIQERMVEIIDDVYCLTNFLQYQNKDGLEKIRANNRERQQRYRDKKKQLLIESENSNVTSNVTSRLPSISNSISNNINNNIIDIEEISNYFDNVYKIYPRKVNKVQAKETFEHKLRGLEKEDAHKQAIVIYKMLEKQITLWSKENGGDGRQVEHIPHMSTWLNDNIENSPHFKRGRK